MKAVQFTSLINENYKAETIADCRSETDRDIFLKVQQTEEPVTIGLTKGEPVEE